MQGSNFLGINSTSTVGVAALLTMGGTFFPSESVTTLKEATFVESNGQVKSALISLLHLTLPQEESISDSLSLTDAKNLTQKYWYQGSKERWKFEERFKDIVQDEAKRNEVVALFKQLKWNFWEDVHAQKEVYDYAGVLGALTKRMEQRIQYLIAEWQQGVRFRRIVLFTSERPLDAAQEADMIAKKIPIKGNKPTEADVMEWLWQNVEMPSSLRETPCLIVRTAMKRDKRGKEIRPSTGDTFLAWLENTPELKSNLSLKDILLISNDIHVKNQDMAAQSTFPPTFSIETIGAGVPLEQVKPGLVFDTLARCIFMEESQLHWDLEKRSSVAPGMRP